MARSTRSGKKNNHGNSISGKNNEASATKAETQQMDNAQMTAAAAKSNQVTIEPTNPKAEQLIEHALAKITDPRDADVLFRADGKLKIITSGTSKLARKQDHFLAIGSFARFGSSVKLAVEHHMPTLQALVLFRLLIQALTARFGDSNSSVGTTFGANDHVSNGQCGKTIVCNPMGVNVATVLARNHTPAMNSFWYVGESSNPELLTVHENKVFLTSIADATIGNPGRYVGSISSPMRNPQILRAMAPGQFLIGGKHGTLGILVVPKQGHAYSVPSGQLPQGMTFAGLSKDGKLVTVKTSEGKTRTVEMKALGAQLHETAQHLAASQPAQSRR